MYQEIFQYAIPCASCALGARRRAAASQSAPIGKARRRRALSTLEPGQNLGVAKKVLAAA